MNLLKSLIVFSVILFESENCWASKFPVYWNIPTFFCKKFGLPTLNVTERFGIIQNEDDIFRGEQITIFYDPGNFPALLQNSSSNQLFIRNGGVPQEGNLTDHLEKFIKNLDHLMPNPNNNGIAIIDFESWRPVYRHNFGILQPYKELSFELVREQHPFWLKHRVEAEAKRLFELHARIFMEATIKMAKQYRPKALWGYYGLPFCFNGKPSISEDCKPAVKKENDGIQWLFDASDVIYPSVYMPESIPFNQRSGMVAGRIAEAIRVSNDVNEDNPSVLAYARYMFSDTRKYYSEEDVFNVINAVKSAGANGVVLWGSSYDLNTKPKCEEFYQYLENILGPIVQSFEHKFRLKIGVI